MSSRSTPVRTASLWLALLGSTGALALAGTAFAQGWGTYEQAFPANPCHDGWSACIVDGERVSPDMTAEGPSDMRVGWFDLEPSSSFSPFTGLTEYTGEAPAVAAADGGAGELPAGDDGFDGVASAPSEESVKAQQEADEAAVAKAAQRAAAADARREEEEAAQAQRDAQRAAAQAVKESQSRREEADRLAAQAAQAESAQQDALRKEAEVARKAADDAERKRREAERQEADRRAAQEEAKRKSEEQERRRQEVDAAAKAAEDEARRSAEEDRKRREAEDAERRAEQERVAAEKAEQDRIAAEKAAADKAEQERLAAEAAAANDGTAAAPPPPEDDGAADVATAPPLPVDDGACDNLQALEPPAMLGKMSEGQVQCLEGRLSQASKMTEKKKISVLLMTNAFSKGDKKKWEDLVKRHLDEIDQSDPDLCYKYALYLAGRGSSRASGVIRWANVALENRTVWTGDTYKSRVNSLFKMRAAASQSLWASAEKEHAASPSDATASKIDKYRNMTKVSAREWYEYAKMSGKDTTKPLQLCMSAAGTSDYCDGG